MARTTTYLSEPYRAPRALASWEDRYPGLAVEDGRLGERAPAVLDVADEADALAFLLGELYPHASWNH